MATFNTHPRIGIRPTIDGRRGPMKLRESLEDQTMAMAQAAAKLFTENLRYSDGEPVEVVIADTTIGRVPESAACAAKFRRENVAVTLTVTPCWCYGSETMDMERDTIKGVWGFNGTERPGAVYLASVLATHAQKGLPAFGIYGHEVQDRDQVTDIPEDVKEKLLRFGRAAIAVASMRGKSYLQIGSVCMGIGGSIMDQAFMEDYLGLRVESVDEVEILRRMEEGIYNKEEYENFHAALASAERAPLHDFDTGAEQSAQPDPDAHGKKADTVTVYEGCMPIEIMAARGADTMRFGPLRPVGLVNPNTGHRPWANVQLRAENKERTLYNIVGFQTNLKWGEQKRVFSMIPGLENAEFVRYGVMHRNTFLDAPRVLSAQLCLKEHPNVFFAGQITGFEGYMESAACGLLAARSLYARLEGKELPAPPADTMCGALVQYLTTENKHFQPMGANMGILPPLPEESRPRDKRLRYMAQAQRAVASFQHWLDETSL